MAGFKAPLPRLRQQASPSSRAADTIEIISNGDLKGGFINSLAETMPGTYNVSINTWIKTVIPDRVLPVL